MKHQCEALTVCRRSHENPRCHEEATEVKGAYRVCWAHARAAEHVVSRVRTIPLEFATAALSSANSKPFRGV